MRYIGETGERILHHLALLDKALKAGVPPPPPSPAPPPVDRRHLGHEKSRRLIAKSETGAIQSTGPERESNASFEIIIERMMYELPWQRDSS